jgi:hypothetical protein
VKPVSSGLINQTFLIATDTEQYIMQRLHPVLSSPKIRKDILAVTRHLKVMDFPSPVCVLTKTGQVLAKDKKTSGAYKHNCQEKHLIVSRALR